MIRALFTAATGMNAQQTKIDVISNNLANVNTTGFKKDQTHFEDLVYQTIRMPGGRNPQGITAPTGLQVGHGTRLTSVSKSHAQGSLLQTQNPLDMAIEGKGFFRLQQSNGQYAYTRDGVFHTDSEGRVVTAGGDPLDPPLTLPESTRQVLISRDGIVSALSAEETEPTEIGRIELTTFANPAGLENLGHNTFRQTDASGDPLMDYPGGNGLGHISQGFLEQSNVQVVEEMIALITSQRAYEINSKVIQTADAMLQNTTQIR